MSAKQYVLARLFLSFKSIISNTNEPPTLSECLLYEECFKFQQKGLLK